jgi:energy-coupling factor transport system permease protein
VIREIHPLAWWAWALGLAAAASQLSNLWLLLLLVAAVALVVQLRRPDQPWAYSFRLYLLLGLWMVLIRVTFRVIFGSPPGTVLIPLPMIALPDWVAGLTLFGPLTLEGLAAALADGTRLATLVICVGSANALANPKRTIKSLPASLYELGTILVIAVSAVPQLAQSVVRVRAAQRLRGVPAGRLWQLRRTVVPVLEDALERSMALARSMDARGYGRASDLASTKYSSGALLGALVGLTAGSYGLLDPTSPRWLATPMVMIGLVLAGLGLWMSGRNVNRTRYRPDRWGASELCLLALGTASVVMAWWISMAQPLISNPAPTLIPQTTMPSLLLPLLALTSLLVTSRPNPGSRSRAHQAVSGHA